MEIKSDFRFGSIDVTILLLYSYSYCDISSAKIFTHKISVENLSTHIFSSCIVHHLVFEILGLNFHLVSCKIERSILALYALHASFLCLLLLIIYYSLLILSLFVCFAENVSFTFHSVVRLFITVYCSICSFIWHNHGTASSCDNVAFMQVNKYSVVHASEKLRRLIKLDLTHTGSDVESVCLKSISPFFILHTAVRCSVCMCVCVCVCPLSASFIMHPIFNLALAFDAATATVNVSIFYNFCTFFDSGNCERYERS